MNRAGGERMCIARSRNSFGERIRRELFLRVLRLPRRSLARWRYAHTGEL